MPFRNWTGVNTSHQGNKTRWGKPPVSPLKPYKTERREFSCCRVKSWCDVVTFKDADDICNLTYGKNTLIIGV